jgi:hypothetical protein
MVDRIDSMTLSNADRARLLAEVVLKVDAELREEERKTMDFALELEELIKDYLTWNSMVPVEERRAEIIKSLEAQIELLKEDKNDV